MKLLSGEVDSLVNELLAKEGQIAVVEKQLKEIDDIEKEVIERNPLINQLNLEINDLETKAKETRSNINGYQNKLHDLKKKVIIPLQTK